MFVCDAVPDMAVAAEFLQIDFSDQEVLVRSVSRRSQVNTRVLIRQCSAAILL